MNNSGPKDGVGAVPPSPLSLWHIVGGIVFFPYHLLKHIIFVAVCAHPVAMMAGATEHSHNKDLLTTVALMNIGMMESAFEGKQAQRHLTSIKKQVSELLMLHFVTVLCFVEVGAPRVGLKPESKTKSKMQ